MPGTDALHSALVGGNIHVPYRFSYADAAAREAEAGAVPGDVGCLALQEDDNSLWLLTDDDPLTWVAVADAGGAAVDAGDVTYTPTTAADWDSDADPGDVDDALDQLAERVDDLEGAGGGTGDVTWAIIQASQLANEVMGYPSLVGIDIDLDAANQWWDKVGTPSTAVTQVDLAGEGGITETWEYALKTVADGANEGFSQRYTYADQPRIKSGRALSAIAAIWVGTAGRTVTMKLITSAATEVTATATAQGWTICKCENLTLDGTYVDLQFIVDGADTFYVVPLGVNIGAKAVPLRARGLRYVNRVGAPPSAKNMAGLADEATWTDVDITAHTGPLAAIGRLVFNILKTNDTGWDLCARRNGDTDDTREGTLVGALSAGNFTARSATEVAMILDDGQVFEYYLDRWVGSSTLAGGDAYVLGWWEWE